MTPQPFFEWRGSPIRVDFDVRALARLGWEVDLLAMPVGEDRDIPGVRLMRVPNVLRVRKLSIGPSLPKAVLDVFLFFQALGLALRRRYDVVHGVEEAGALAVAVGRLTRARVVFEKHSDPSSYREGWLRNVIMALYAKVEAFTVRHADAVIGTGPGLVEQARRMNRRIPAHHIFDIPSSLVEPDPDRTAQEREGLRRRPGDRLIAYVGSFAVYQGINLMFESIPLVVRDHPEARFVVIGGTEEEIAGRRRWLEERGAADAVVFPGKIPPDKLPHTLAAADILLSPRRAGANTPLKILDYLKARAAIVACDHPANRLLLDDDTALLVAPQPDALAEGIGRLLADDALRAKLAAAGRRLVDDTYNFGEFTRRLEACYRALALRPGSAWS
jgi:glycosyltransferase involved in cell wall biosynthesis